MSEIKWIHIPMVIFTDPMDPDPNPPAVGIGLAHAYESTKRGSTSVCGRQTLGFFRQPFEDAAYQRKCTFCERKAK